MYYVSAQGVDERMINVHYYYYRIRLKLILWLCDSLVAEVYGKADSCNVPFSESTKNGVNIGALGLVRFQTIPFFELERMN